MGDIPGGLQAKRYVDWIEATRMWADNKPTDVLKAGSTILDLIKNSGFSNDPHLPVISGGLKDAKAVLAPASFLKTLNDVRDETYSWWTGDKKGFHDLGRKLLDFVGPVQEFTDLVGKKLMSIPSEFLNSLKGTHGVVLAVKSGWDCANSLIYLKNGDDRTQLNLTIIKLVNQISLLTLGVMVALTCFYGMVFAPLTFSLVSVVNVVFGFGSYFYENIGKEKK